MQFTNLMLDLTWLHIDPGIEAGIVESLGDSIVFLSMLAMPDFMMKLSNLKTYFN
jgi:hypothetical protein